MDSLQIKLAQRYMALVAASGLCDLGWVKAVLSRLDPSDNPTAVHVLERLRKSLLAETVAAFPSADLVGYLRDWDVPEDEVQNVLNLHIRPSRQKKGTTYEDALSLFSKATASSCLYDRSLFGDTEAGARVLVWLEGWKALKAHPKKVWQTHVKKVLLSKSSGSEDASVLGDRLLLDVTRGRSAGVARGMLTHEMGHLAEKALGFNPYDEPWGLPPFVSEYAESRPNSEDFAETYRVFIEEPGILKRTCPAKYNAIKKLIG